MPIIPLIILSPENVIDASLAFVIFVPKLLLSQVQIGTEVRQIVSGIAMKYKPEELIGKKVLVLVNLNPAKIRGNVSNGMLLCAGEGDELELIQVPNSKSGSKVK